MYLTDLLCDVRVVKLFSAGYGETPQTRDASVRSIQYDSRKIRRGDLFVAIRGATVDGHSFIDKAIQNGAKVLLVEDDSALPDSRCMHAGVTKIVVPNSRVALATLSGNYFDRPSRKLILVGITGTNGKTTTAHLLQSVMEEDGAPAGLIGTIEYTVGDDTYPATHTTPESLELNGLLATMVERGCTRVAMEVSSHSLVQHRVSGLEFSAGVFTNLTQDHLDFHGNMDRYAAAKRILFDNLTEDAWAISNADDPYAGSVTGTTRARQMRYGLHSGVDVRAEDVRMSMRGMELSIICRGKKDRLATGLTGRFNVSNILAACAAGSALGVPWAKIREGIQRLRSIRGRFEQIPSPSGWTAVLDYAHTPDALLNCLQAIREIVPIEGEGKVITVFGCGGDRDAGKRPIMGRVASGLSDLTIITSDNPRHEDPEEIIRQAEAGVVLGKTVFTEVDRRQAIRRGLSAAAQGDVVLIAGKGHEPYQVIGDKKLHFDDREEIEAFIKSDQ
jgi:UDP-N-acetylmuramoyl-L-alanyl-D-glutamate--2,6-diaminopimelate ligase